MSDVQFDDYMRLLVAVGATFIVIATVVAGVWSWIEGIKNPDR